MQNSAPSFPQDNPKPNNDLEIFKLLQRAATGFSDALDVVLDLNPRAPAAAQLAHALGRGLRGVSALKLLRSMGSSGAADNTAASEMPVRQAAPLCAAFQASHAESTVGVKKRRPRRHFDQDYKRQVAQLIRQKHMTISQVSRDLNLTYSAVRRWSLDFGAAPPNGSGQPVLADPEHRISDLEEQLRQLQSDNELLKNASALFARELRKKA